MWYGVVTLPCNSGFTSGFIQVKADAKKYIDNLKKKEQDASTATSEALGKVASLEAEQSNLQSQLEALSIALKAAQDQAANIDLTKVNLLKMVMDSRKFNEIHSCQSRRLWIQIRSELCVMLGLFLNGPAPMLD